ncbi:MAG TPA: IS110 family transposase [Candidatus Acidoferrales bacterium]|nr:IS110 family transposase [Candidatus Acidoferrales bacterium]
MVLGVDVSKGNLHAVLLEADGRMGKRSFPNREVGFEQLVKWLRNRGVDRVHVCMEATGGWGEDLGIYLHDRGHTVSIVNPARIKAFGQSEGVRTKTDDVDAALIARFCQTQAPDAWKPPSPKERELQALIRRREGLIDMRTQEINRASSARRTDAVRSSITEHIAYLDTMIANIEADIRRLVDEDDDLRGKRNLLTSIPGIGEQTAHTILGEVPGLSEFRDVKAVAAHAGLSPKHHQSGQSPGISRLCKAGNANLRKALYFPALAAMRSNPTLKAFADRLQARGKRKMVVIAAVMRKLLIIAYGVLKGGRAFAA